MHTPLYFIFVLLISKVIAQSVCSNCITNCTLNTNVMNYNYTCYGEACQAYGIPISCYNDTQWGFYYGFSCLSGYNSFYTTNTSLYTYCVACNYSIPQCLLCAKNSISNNACILCSLPYILINGVCYNQDGTTIAGSANSSTQSIFSLFVVAVVFLALILIILAASTMIRYKREKI